MKFRLDVNAQEKIKNVALEQFTDIFEKMKMDDFIILEPESSIDDAVFIQALMLKKDLFDLEIRFEREGSFKQYQKTFDEKETFAIFEAFFNEKNPAIEQWEDITSYLFEYYYKPGERLSKENVHPVFAKHFVEDFYYSTAAHLSPFGNDTGFVTMQETEVFLKRDGENVYHIGSLFNEEELFSEDGNKLGHLNMMVYEEDLHHLYRNMQDVISAGFTNLRVNGMIMEDMKGLTLLALDKLNEIEPTDEYKKMIADLEQVEAVKYADD